MGRGVWSLLFILTLPFIVAPPGALAAAYTFTPIDVPFPGGGGTDAHGINDAGQIVGAYGDATGGHGFLYSGGTFSTINVPFPGTLGTDAHGINNAGQIVGRYVDATGREHGFLDNGGDL
jgi:probable HAF family extracellular repeat protein